LAPWLQTQLQLLRHTRGHAVLLQGPSGLGQFELATALAATWLCEAPGELGACGRCSSCHSFSVHTHADMMALMPETEALERQWPLSDTAQAELDAKKRKPSKEIRVESLREVVLFGQRTAATERGKVVMAISAERMNLVSANTLLKTLEEPPGDLRFILATNAVHELLPTVRSRCVSHIMACPETQEALEWMLAQGLPKAEAPVLLRLSAGRPFDALALHKAGLGASLWLNFPQAVSRGDVSVLQKLSAAQALQALHKLCLDLTRQAFGASPLYFEAGKLPQSPAIEPLLAWSKSLSQAARTIEHPFGLGLLHEALMARAQQALMPTS
jgi:DNA polymerase-3 subunit delta'